MSGWIKIHRSILEWEWYEDTNTFRLFMHLILKANHKDRNYKGKLIKRGSLVTGRELLSVETGLSIQKIRTCLERLKSTNEITIKSSSKGTEIQVVKYNEYQLVTNDVTNKQPTSNQQVTTNKNVKNEKNEKKEELYRKFNHLSLSLNEFNKLIELGYKKEDVDNVLDKIENYKKNNKYSSLYLTSKSWLKKDYKTEKETSSVNNLIGKIAI